MQCQGSEFIQNIQQAAEAQNMPSAARTPATADFSEKAEGAVSHNDDSDPMTSVAAQSAIEIGYTEATVTDAVRQLRRQRGMGTFGAEELLSLIMDNEEEENRTKSNGLKEHDAKNDNPNQGNPSNEEEKEADNGASSNTDANIRSLVEENRQMREESMCRICLEESSCIVFLPCGHMVTCPRCARALAKCLVCMKAIKGTVKAYLS
ncbi:hypothetical protein ScPMuIL_003993 [Solemya velum]